MQVTFKGNPVTLEGTVIKAGNPAPTFTAIDNNLKPISSDLFTGKKVYVSVPSIDTDVCDTEVRRFNQEAANLEGVKVYTISMDLPFAQARWCGAAGIENVQTLSDYKDHDFGVKFGTYIKELGLLARAVFVVDEHNTVTYVEYCKEISQEPDYEAVLNALK